MTANPGDPDLASTEVPARTGRIPADTFSNRLLLARKLAGLTIREAAAQTGLNYGSWSNWENGKRPLDILDICQKIASQLDIDFDWLLLGGPLAGARGMPVRKARDATGWYRALTERPGTERPTDNRPVGRPQTGSPSSGPRRAARLHPPVAA
jgi:transcriptional regulator with XRE-family HTH domain